MGYNINHTPRRMVYEKKKEKFKDERSALKKMNRKYKQNGG